MIGLASRGIAQIPFIDVLLGESTRCVGRLSSMRGFSAVAGWGVKPSGRRALSLGQRAALPVWLLEDGFLRSHGTEDRFPPLSVVVDQQGIYYDSTRPSALELLLNSSQDLLSGITDNVEKARQLLLAHRLSKYNHAPMLEELPALVSRLTSHPSSTPHSAIRRVLVVDQTLGERSIALGGADATSFTLMLAAARAEHPEAQILVKTHPEVTAGRKRGYLSDVREDARTLLVREAVNPLSLIEQVDKVYVVTSTMGFEALLAGKPVTVFGVPWYAGWGVTDDRQTCPRRTRSRSVLELFAAGYFHYTRYLNPFTHQRGSIFDVIEWLCLQREKIAHFPNRFVAVAYWRWKKLFLRPILGMAHEGVHFAPNARAVSKQRLCDRDAVIHWGRDTPDELQFLATRSGAPLVHMEDGFYRSVGLGSDLIRPYSLVLDRRGLYFDPRTPSDLEDLLNRTEFLPEEHERAKRVRETIVTHGLTKYNLESVGAVDWPSQGRHVVLVPGQVEDDASIRHGCQDVRTNLGLLQATRAACPDAFIVFKPHPDVMSGNRLGHVPAAQALAYADHIEIEASVVSCLAAAAAVHTMTSMSGFEALLREKLVVVYGRPFYAGWGLTSDRVSIPRRTRTLTLDELVAGTLLRYPLYWDWDLKGFTSCEAVLQQLVEKRNALIANNELKKLKYGRWNRLLRKLRAWVDVRTLPPK